MKQLRQRAQAFALLLLLLATTIVSTTQVYAVEDQKLNLDFAADNDITWYDPVYAECKVSAGEAAVVESSDNLESILRFLTSKGLTLAAAAGFAGNMKQESNWNPRALQPGMIAPENFTPINGRGFGLVQWTFDARQKPLVAFARSQNKPTTDMGVQLGYVWKELTEVSQYKALLSQIATTQDPRAAAVAVHKIYEVSADSDATVLKLRAEPAAAIHAKYKSVIQDGTGVTNLPTNPGAPATGALDGCVAGGAAMEVGTEGTGYLQCDPRWAKLAFGSSTLCVSGCGVATMANIVTALTGNTVTPADAVKVANANNIYVEGAGSSWLVAPALARHYGLTANPVAGNVAAISAALRAGSMVTMAGSGPEPFSSTGHYITIRGIDSEGKWLIYDSSGDAKENTSHSWDPQTVLSAANSKRDASGSFYAISK